jgi:hypothetical protein
MKYCAHASSAVCLAAGFNQRQFLMSVLARGIRLGCYAHADGNIARGAHFWHAAPLLRVLLLRRRARLNFKE